MNWSAKTETAREDFSRRVSENVLLQATSEFPWVGKPLHLAVRNLTAEGVVWLICSYCFSFHIWKVRWFSSCLWMIKANFALINRNLNLLNIRINIWGRLLCCKTELYFLYFGVNLWMHSKGHSIIFVPDNAGIINYLCLLIREQHTSLAYSKAYYF